MKGSFGRLLAGLASMMAFSDAAKRDRDDARRAKREAVEETTKSTASRFVRWIHPDGLAHYVTPNGMVRTLGPPTTMEEVRARAASAKLEPLRLLSRAERRRLVGVEAWRRGVRAPVRR